ncbi:immunoglobulin kappa light chain-like isoform X2 [Oenanthe melanoleuca]|uniref:immunoglobulin kappa light chain-like isoform X2 n=1 Tax=Oenanthe melanoleuca TaxID=2939378 RepID=UPI0024C0F51E|nr:immunoglobulin kappa light chain-like isoform X2 [Oenanthe melanoleuca]
MLLLPVLLATSFWSCVDMQAVPGQSPGQQTQLRGTSASMSCKLQRRETVHWYKQLPGEQPKRILYDSEGTPVFDSTSDRNRMQVWSDPAQPTYHLTINSLTPRDSGIYFCAYWYVTTVGYYNKVFGSGTKLVVSEKASSPPANSEILHTKHKNQTTYVCLIEKFYPEVIRVTWTDDEKEVTDNVVKGDTWQSPKDDEYSIASWLTVPAENKDKNYYCKYEHEEKQASLSTQDSMKTASQEEDCGKVFNRDQLMHRTAYLVYIILLLKSSMYYLILLFFSYKVWASTKHQGKKA